MLALKQSLEKDQAALRKFEWIETTIISYKDEETSNAQKRCCYGAEGALQKVPIASSQADMPGGLRGRQARSKKEDITEYMQRAAACSRPSGGGPPARVQRGQVLFDRMKS